jgi:type 1 fimbria pilin
VGTVLWQSPQVTPTNPPTVHCSTDVSYGVINSPGVMTPGPNVAILPTKIAGIGYQLVHDDSTGTMHPYPCCLSGPQGTWSFSIASALTLVKTGPITSGSELPAGQLGSWRWGKLITETFNLLNSVTIIDPACSVNSNSIIVTLPNIATASLKGVNSVAASTQFAIRLTCSAGATVAITLDTASQAAGTTGVINSSGSATGVGVQLVDSNGTAVSFGTTTTVGATPDGALDLSYFARYYQLATTVGAGTVKATATFTISYQ